MPTRIQPSYASMGPELSLERTKEQHNGVGYPEFKEFYRQIKEDKLMKKDAMKRMGIKSYPTFNKLLSLIEREDSYGK